MIQAITILSVGISVACALCTGLSITVAVCQRLNADDLWLMLCTALSFGIAAVALAVIAGLLWPL